MLTMSFVAILATCPFRNSYPFSLGSRCAGAFDGTSPGLAAFSRHPLPLALWSGAHLPPNGDVSHVLLFGNFAALGVATIPMFDYRARRCQPQMPIPCFALPRSCR